MCFKSQYFSKIKVIKKIKIFNNILSIIYQKNLNIVVVQSNFPRNVYFKCICHWQWSKRKIILTESFQFIFVVVFQGKFSKKPFVKFICHSASYIFFLLLLALASQRAEMILIDIFGESRYELNFVQQITSFKQINRSNENKILLERRLF